MSMMRDFLCYHDIQAQVPTSNSETMDSETIAFDHELGRGIVTYNEKVGRWWSSQAENSIHSYAYRNIADFVSAAFSKPPRLILDYACGSGNLLTRLHRRFPDACLIGLDGSSFLLGKALRRLARSGRQALQCVSLRETLLPNFDLPPLAADLVLFVFPNLVPCSGAEDGSRHTGRLSPADLAVAQELSRRVNPEDGKAAEDPTTICATLLRDRLVSLNIRGLLKRGGICMRVEYGNVRREELPKRELLRTGFEEGSLDCEVGGHAADQWFRVVASKYYRSGVMEDVYHQSGDANDKYGGFFITVLAVL
jgi:SAM-dependent methyltransferase